MLIGLTGRNASGKTTVVEWFSERGFVAESCSDSIRTWLAGKGGSQPGRISSRAEENCAGRAAAAFWLRCLSVLMGGMPLSIRIRTPAEVDALRQREDFILIEVVANPRIRWSRAKIDQDLGDPSSEAEFIESEKKELEASIKPVRHLSQLQLWPISKSRMMAIWTLGK